MTYPSSLDTEDFIEMLGRGDQPEQVAQYAGVTVAAIERRFYRLPKQVQAEILKSRGLQSFHWWSQKKRTEYRNAGRSNSRKKVLA